MAETKTLTAPDEPKKPAGLSEMLAAVDVKKRFEEILGKRAPGFISSIMSLYNANKQLQEADPRSILQSAAIAATLDLPVNQNLGFAFIIPYRQKAGPSLAQFQMGYKGFIQLGIRTGQYETIHATEVYKDEIKSWNPLTGEFEGTDSATWKLRQTGDFRQVAGYLAYFKLLNGFKKTLYMTQAEVQIHGKKYSKSFDNPMGIWMVNPHAMCLKTVIKLLLSKYGLLSIQMEKAIEVDQGVIDTTGEVTYQDRKEDEPAVSKPTGAAKTINEDQMKLLFAKIGKAGIEKEEVQLYIKGTFQRDHFHDLTIEEMSKTLKWLEQAPPDIPDLPLSGKL
jgi:recombination protein RecT